MTTNAIIPVDASAWVDLHAGSGISAGTALVCQIKSTSTTRVVFVDSVAQPAGDVDAAGGIETNGALNVVNSTPAVGESTWARTRSQESGTNISVQEA